MKVLVCVLVLLAGFLPDAEGNALETLVGSKLVGLVSDLWSQGRVEFLGRECRFSVTPSIYRWELYRNGKFWCPGFAPFTGTARKYSESGAVEHATRDFVHKAFEHGLITEEEANLWLNN